MKQELKSRETQDLIINTSFELFYEKGYNATSIPDVMKKTSLSKGAFYHHFKNKHEIGTRVIEVIIKNKKIKTFSCLFCAVLKRIRLETIKIIERKIFCMYGFSNKIWLNLKKTPFPK